MHVIQKFLGPNYFFWSALKVPPSDFIQNMSQVPSKCLKQWIKVDKLNYFKKQGGGEFKKHHKQKYFEQTWKKTQIHFSLYSTWDIRKTLMTDKIVLEFLLNKLRLHAKFMENWKFLLEIILRMLKFYIRISCTTLTNFVEFHPNIIINSFQAKEGCKKA